MKIGIFSKFDMIGGSERRCFDLLRSIAATPDFEAVLLCPNSKVEFIIDKRVNVIRNCFSFVDLFYELDCLIIVNSDSRNFTRADWWAENGVDLSRIKRMVYIFNFIVSPSENLTSILPLCKNISICVGNLRFFDEISNKDKYEKIRHLPRLVLESGIDPSLIPRSKSQNRLLRIGQHSKPASDKWNMDYVQLIETVNRQIGEYVKWDFLGINKKLASVLLDVENVILRPENSIGIFNYLQDIDIYIFFPSWSRQECWARCVGEAMMSGCPILATDSDGGNRMQVVSGNNGFLCSSVDDFSDSIIRLYKDRRLLETMGDNSKLMAKDFSSEKVAKKLLAFLGFSV